MNIKEKQRKKAIVKRKFLSAPNLPIDGAQVVTAELFPASPKEIGKYKNKTEDHSRMPLKKTKPKSDNKEVGRFFKRSDDRKKTGEDHQWPIKKTIAKLMGEAGQGARVRSTLERSEIKLKTSPNRAELQKSKSELAKRVTNRSLRADAKRKELNKRSKTDPQRIRNLIETGIKQDASGAKLHENPRVQSEPLAEIERRYSHSLQSNSPDFQKSNKKANMQRLKNLFQVFKAPEESAKSKKETEEPQRNNLNLQEELKLVEKQKKVLKKKNTIPEKMRKKFQANNDSSTVKLEVKKKIVTEKIPSNKADAPTEMKKQRKFPIRKVSKVNN